MPFHQILAGNKQVTDVSRSTILRRRMYPQQVLNVGVQLHGVRTPLRCGNGCDAVQDIGIGRRPTNSQTTLLYRSSHSTIHIASLYAVHPQYPKTRFGR